MDPIGKGEEALASIITALALTGTRGDDAVDVVVLTGRDDAANVIPRVACVIPQGQSEEVVRGTSIFRNNGHVEVVTNVKDEAESVHTARVKAVGDALITTTIKSDLSSAVSAYYVYEIYWGAPEHQPQGDHTITRWPFQIVHCCSDLT